MAMQERHRPSIETLQREQYKYYSLDQVLEAFGALGIKSSFVEAMYVSGDCLSAVAVARAGEDAAIDHFENNPIIRGVDQLKAISDTDRLLAYFAGRHDDAQQSMHLSAIENVVFEGMIIPPHVFNVVVQVQEKNDSVRKTSGAIYSGEKTFIMGADIQNEKGVEESVSGGDILLSADGERFSQEEVNAALKKLHYGPSRRMLGDMTVEEDGKKATAVLMVDVDLSIFEGIEQLTHTMLAALQIKGKIRPGTTPIFTGISHVSIPCSVLPPSSLTITTQEVGRRGQNFDVEGTIRCGDTKVMTIAFSGRGTRDEIVANLVSDRQEKQENERPLFL